MNYIKLVITLSVSILKPYLSNRDMLLQISMTCCFEVILCPFPREILVIPNVNNCQKYASDCSY